MRSGQEAPSPDAFNIQMHTDRTALLSNIDHATHVPLQLMREEGTSKTNSELRLAESLLDFAESACLMYMKINWGISRI